MENLRIIPLDDVVAFPGMPVTLGVDVGADSLVLLLPRAGDCLLYTSDAADE